VDENDAEMTAAGAEARMLLLPVLIKHPVMCKHTAAS
jgi:hypothetical protein